MKKLRYLLCFFSILLLIGCTSKTPALPTENEDLEADNRIEYIDDSLDSDENTNTGVANPWTEIQKDVIEQNLHTNVNIPEEAENVSCTALLSEGLYQVNFDYLNISFVYRLKKTEDPEDISGTYYEWGEPDDDNVNGNPAQVYYCEENEEVHELALWVDEDEGVSLSLFASADHDLDGFDIIAVAINLVSAD